jgi:tyrosyl-tRNA synthetase
VSFLLFQELKQRNLIKDCSDEKKLEEILNKEKVNFYCGFDPTANSLTLGHLVQINIILLLCKNKHNPFILIGCGTGLIGDPKENQERELISNHKILENGFLIQEQLKKLLIIPQIKFLNNYDWISKTNLISFFRNYGKLFNINYMISKEIVAKRLKKGISYAEFSYMILQALDFYELYKKFNVRLQFGGSDQWGNITSGLELIRKIELNKINQNNKPVGFSIPLLLDSQGIKFGKSEKNNLWLDKKLSSPYQVYQYLLNVSDENVIDYLKKLTLLEMQEIIFLEESTKINPKKRLAQKKLSEQVIIFLYGTEEFNNCFRINQILFNRETKKINLEELVFLQNYLNFIQIKKNISLVEALVNTKLSKTKNEAKRLIKAKSIKICGNTIDQIDFNLTFENAWFRKYILITKKNKFNSLVIFK